jgi:heat shock protein HslJ
MKRTLIAAILTCIILSIFMAGCTTVPSTPPATAVVTPVATANPVSAATSVSAQVTDPALQGNWYLKQMGTQGSTAPVIMTNVQININFDNAGNLMGTTGCNNYNAKYTLSGQQMFNGLGMTIGPIASTNKYCTDTADTETTYFQILQKTTSYVVNSNGQLTLTDNLNSNLVYTRSQVSPMPSY